MTGGFKWPQGCSILLNIAHYKLIKYTLYHGLSHSFSAARPLHRSLAPAVARPLDRSVALPLGRVVTCSFDRSAARLLGRLVAGAQSLGRLVARPLGPVVVIRSAARSLGGLVARSFCRWTADSVARSPNRLDIRSLDASVAWPLCRTKCLFGASSKAIERPKDEASPKR